MERALRASWTELFSAYNDDDSSILWSDQAGHGCSGIAFLGYGWTSADGPQKRFCCPCCCFPNVAVGRMSVLELPL